MTEVDIYGGGHHTRLNNQLVCLWGAPSPVYKGVEEGEGVGLSRRTPRSPTPTGSRIPPFPLLVLGEKEGEGRWKETRGGPLPNSDWAWGEPPPLLLSPPFH